MDNHQPDKHLKKNTSHKCKSHPSQTPKYYCSDVDCRTHLCALCMKQHPKEHLPKITTIEDVKSQTLDLLKKETLSRFDKLLDDILKSREMDDLFKETFGNLMHQNATMDLDGEDIADILADTLQRKYFEKGIVVAKKIQEDISVNFSSADLIAFDYQFDDGEDETHDECVQSFCRFSSEYYCIEELGSFYAESKGQVIFWNNKDQTVLCKDPLDSKENSKKYKIPLAFQLLTVLESEGELLFVVASNDKLIVCLITEENDQSYSDYDEEFSENYPSLNTRNEFSLEEKIVFLTSDHVNHLFVVTEGQSGLKANIYALKSQNNELEFLKVFSFEPFGLPTKVVFDRVNNLLFILSGEFLKVYKYCMMPAASLHIIFKIKTTSFRWHETTQKLLLIDLGKLYQFRKGKFRLLRVITGSTIKPIELINQGILCVDKNTPGLLLLSQKNLKEQKSFILPSVESEMKSLQTESFERFYGCGFASDVDPHVRELSTTFQTVRVVAETPDHLLIFANVHSSQYASQRVVSDSWRPFGGTIYTQRLLRYDSSQKKYQLLE